MHDHQPVAALPTCVVNPRLQPHSDLIIPFAPRRPHAEQRCLVINDLALFVDNLGISATTPRTDVDFHQPRVMRRFMPVLADMLGDNRQCLQRTARRRRIEPERLLGAEVGGKRRAHGIGLGKTHAGQRRVLRRALHPLGSVEDGFAVACDENAALKCHARAMP